MEEKITVPKMGESITSALLAAWLKKGEEYVREGEDLYELESDKATMAVPAPVSGKLKILVEEGEEIEIGQVVGTIDTSAAAPQDDKPHLSPAVRRIVTEEDLDTSAIKGTGKEGRIIKEDAQKAAVLKRVDTEPPAQTPGGQREKMSSLRQTIARNLVQSKQEAAHLTTFNEINMQRVMEIRKKYKDEFLETHGIKLGFMSFFITASCAALKKYPVANAFVEDKEIVHNNQQNIGIAVSTEKGLIVPVIKNAGAMSFDMIEKQIAAYGEQARTKKLNPGDLTGGTFTITNGGVFGSLLSTPIPTPPQSAILGMHAIQERPVAEEGSVVIRPMMYVALTYDHRIMDGREAVGFLVTVKSLLEEPDKLLLGIP